MIADAVPYVELNKLSTNETETVIETDIIKPSSVEEPDSAAKIEKQSKVNTDFAINYFYFSYNFPFC